MVKSISPGQARRTAIAASGIGLAYPDDLRGSLAAIERLGSVQIDTISVVERAHDHVLWTRCPDHRRDSFARLETEPRRILEYWSHASAYLPVADYRYCLPRMKRIRVQGHEWFKTDKEVAARVLRRIRAEGPMRAQDFEGAKGREGWWDWKPAKRALEYLFHAGELVVAGRRGFQKVYDLAERALPRGVALGEPTVAEMAAYYVDHATRSLGIFAEEDVAYLRRDGIEGIGAEIASRVEDGRLLPIRMAGEEPESRVGRSANRPVQYYVAPALLRGKRKPELEEERMLILSPFDPLIIDRRRAKRLFGLAYRLECYLPAERREFGYFALPLLFLGRGGEAAIVGRMDAKAERGTKALLVKRMSLAPEPLGEDKPTVAEFARETAIALAGFAAFNGAESIVVERFESENGRLERSLRAAVSRLG